jgi:hypothetical protein
MLTAKRALGVVALAVAVAMSLGANAGAAPTPTGSTGIATSGPSCVTYVYAAERYGNGIYSTGQMECSPSTSMSLRVCVQQYDPVFRYWYDDACKSISSPNNNALKTTAIYPCSPSNYYGYRTHVHSSWGGGGTADVYSGSRNFACT